MELDGVIEQVRSAVAVASDRACCKRPGGRRMESDWACWSRREAAQLEMKGRMETAKCRGEN